MHAKEGIRGKWIKDAEGKRGRKKGVKSGVKSSDAEKNRS